MSLKISAEIGHIEYYPTLCTDLDTYTMADIKSGAAFDDSAFQLELENGGTASVSQWVTPKRTRSYPFARVYNTLQDNTRVTIIPIVKDEGDDGDRDYLQWSTIALMSLLNVYVIPAYYKTADRNPDYDNKITNQEFDYEYIAKKLRELERYQTDPLHWNMKEMESLSEIADKCRHYYYEEITQDTGVTMSSKSYFNSKIEDMVGDVEQFKKTSNEASAKAQTAESSGFDQPNENVLYEKGEITLRNFLGGEYFFTTDEALLIDGVLYLTEKKHTRSTLPSMDDIKDGLLKLIVFKNIQESIHDSVSYPVQACLGLTGADFPIRCTPKDNPQHLDLKSTYTDRLQRVFNECQENGIVVFAAPKGITEEEQRFLIKNAADDS